MMRPKSIKSKDVLSRARSQVKGLTDRPAVDAKVPTPLDPLTAMLAEAIKAESTQEEAKKNLVAATGKLNDTLFTLREAVRANVAVAAMLVGPYSAELSELGGKPRKLGRRGAKKGAGESAAPPDATAHVA